jgi:beta-xylosidase
VIEWIAGTEGFAPVELYVFPMLNSHFPQKNKYPKVCNIGQTSVAPHDTVTLMPGVATISPTRILQELSDLAIE